MIQYRVITECGRNFIWGAVDMSHLFNSLHAKGYKAKLAMENNEYERMVNEVNVA